MTQLLFFYFQTSSKTMKHHIKVTIFATLTVISLCLVRSGHGLPGDYMDYMKRDAKPEIRSAKFDRKAIKDFMNSVARERSYYYGKYFIKSSLKYILCSVSL